MIRSLRFSTFKRISCLLLLCLFTAQSVSYYWIVNEEGTTLELYDPVDAESEKEETKSEKEQDHKLQVDSYAVKFMAPTRSASFLPPVDLQSLSDPEISTPPPERTTLWS